MRISDWSSDVCSSDLRVEIPFVEHRQRRRLAERGEDEPRQRRLAFQRAQPVGRVGESEDARLDGLGLACEPDILAAAVAERAVELTRLVRRNGVARGEGETGGERGGDARNLDRSDGAVAEARKGGDNASGGGRGAQRHAQGREGGRGG